MTTRIHPGIQKDVLPALYSSNIIYLFHCDCDSRYVGCTSQRLVDRMKQHVPEAIRKSNANQDNSNRLGFNKKCPSYTSSIGQHLLKNPSCAEKYKERNFSVLARGRSAFHLSALESTFIQMRSPELCKQKEFLALMKKSTAWFKTKWRRQG